MDVALDLDVSALGAAAGGPPSAADPSTGTSAELAALFSALVAGFAEQGGEDAAPRGAANTKANQSPDPTTDGVAGSPDSENDGPTNVLLAYLTGVPVPLPAVAAGTSAVKQASGEEANTAIGAGGTTATATADVIAEAIETVKAVANAGTEKAQSQAPDADTATPAKMTVNPAAARALARALAAITTDAARPAEQAANPTPAAPANAGVAKALDNQVGPQFEASALANLANLAKRAGAASKVTAATDATQPAAGAAVESKAAPIDAAIPGAAGDAQPVQQEYHAPVAAKASAVDTAIRDLAQSASATGQPAVQAVSSSQQPTTTFASAIAQAESQDAGTVANQLVKAIRIQVRDGVSEARVRLRPEHLGEVQIELKIDRDRVSAVLHVERPDVRAQIEGQGQTLREALAGQGLQLEELVVREDTPRRDGQRQERSDAEPQGRRRRERPDREFELAE